MEGFFFHISPDPVGSGDRIRSELGVHYDANVPGTSGCIGLVSFAGNEKRSVKSSVLRES
ncbi:hypothetical protein QUB56_29485 [Microcoleus sp. AR_TQ3_B6]|uniref:hypothetical protein n=1 Tax=Microcoleus sp. AR_TQ3_B6 TaxID=3055284 RepID=UPI002FD56FF6